MPRATQSSTYRCRDNTKPYDQCQYRSAPLLLPCPAPAPRGSRGPRSLGRPSLAHRAPAVCFPSRRSRRKYLPQKGMQRPFGCQEHAGREAVWGDGGGDSQRVRVLSGEPLLCGPEPGRPWLAGTVVPIDRRRVDPCPPLPPTYAPPHILAASMALLRAPTPALPRGGSQAVRARGGARARWGLLPQVRILREGAGGPRPEGRRGASKSPSPRGSTGTRGSGGGGVEAQSPASSPSCATSPLSDP